MIRMVLIHTHTRARPNLVKGEKHVERPLIDRKLVLLVGIGSRRGAVDEIAHADRALA